MDRKKVVIRAEVNRLVTRRFPSPGFTRTLAQLSAKVAIASPECKLSLRRSPDFLHGDRSLIERATRQISEPISTSSTH